ncbi:MAG: chorismate mutase [Patescibacteria group bacterium]
MDKVDREIIHSLAKRRSLIEKIANFKDPYNIRDLKREKEIIENITTVARKNKLEETFIKDLYKKIMAGDLKQIKNILQK